MEKRENQKYWQAFEGKPNTDQVLIEKARVLAIILVGFVPDFTKSLQSVLAKLAREFGGKFQVESGRDIEGGLSAEALVFLLHYVDRIAFMHLGREGRNTFVDALSVEVRELPSRAYGGGIGATQFAANFDALFAVRQAEYGRHKSLVPEVGGGVFEEFGSKIAGVLGRKDDDQLIVAVGSYALFFVTQVLLEG